MDRVQQDVKSGGSHSLLAGAALAGAQGFAVGFAVVGMLTRVLTLNVSEFNVGLALMTLMYAGAGALGGWYLASESRWKGHELLFALAGVLGCGGGYLVTTMFVAPLFPTANANETMLAAVAILQFAIIGGLTGLFVGLASGSWFKVVLLIVVGALALGIGFLVQSSLTELLAEPLSDLVSRFNDADSVHMIAASLLWGISSAVGGFIGGVGLGYGLER